MLINNVFGPRGVVCENSPWITEYIRRVHERFFAAVVGIFLDINSELYWMEDVLFSLAGAKQTWYMVGGERWQEGGGGIKPVTYSHSLSPSRDRFDESRDLHIHNSLLDACSISTSFSLFSPSKFCTDYRVDLVMVRISSQWIEHHTTMYLFSSPHRFASSDIPFPPVSTHSLDILQMPVLESFNNMPVKSASPSLNFIRSCIGTSNVLVITLSDQLSAFSENGGLCSLGSHDVKI